MLTAMLAQGIYVYLLSSVLLGAAGQILFKYGIMRNSHSTILMYMLDIYMVLGMICYGMSLLIWMKVLKTLDVSTAYPSVSIGYIIVAVAGRLLFGEHITLFKVVGIVLISLGVIFVNSGTR